LDTRGGLEFAELGGGVTRYITRDYEEGAHPYVHLQRHQAAATRGQGLRVGVWALGA
jgi:hypothetical protein